MTKSIAIARLDELAAHTQTGVHNAAQPVGIRDDGSVVGVALELNMGTNLSASIDSNNVAQLSASGGDGSGGGSGGAPTDAPYVTTTTDATLSNETVHADIPNADRHPPKQHGNFEHTTDFAADSDVPFEQYSENTVSISANGSTTVALDSETEFVSISNMDAEASVTVTQRRVFDPNTGPQVQFDSNSGAPCDLTYKEWALRSAYSSGLTQ